jgi:hypothetical protein
LDVAASYRFHNPATCTECPVSIEMAMRAGSTVGLWRVATVSGSTIPV